MNAALEPILHMIENMKIKERKHGSCCVVSILFFDAERKQILKNMLLFAYELGVFHQALVEQILLLHRKSSACSALWKFTSIMRLLQKKNCRFNRFSKKLSF